MTRRLPPRPAPRPQRRRPSPPSPESQRQSARAGRRLVLLFFGGIAATLAGLTVGLPLLFPDAPRKQRTDNHRVILPLLRVRMELRVPQGRPARNRATPPGDLAPDEALLVLTRAEMRDYVTPLDVPAPRESIELRVYFADDLFESTRIPIAVVEPATAPDATLLAVQGGTVWVWANQLVAVAPAGMNLHAEQADLVRLNPDLALDRPGLRARLALGEALLLDGTPADRAGWAFDPATRIAHRRTAPPATALPPLQHAPAPTSPAIAREGRIGATWFGLLPGDMTLPDRVAAQDATGAFLPPMPGEGAGRLWRGRIRPATGDATRPAATDVLEDAAPVPGLDPLPEGGLLMDGPGRLLALADPPSILLAQVGPDGSMQEWLRRLRLDGTTLWQTALPTSGEITTALAEPKRLWLLASPRGLGKDLHAIAPADGRIIRTRHI